MGNFVSYELLPIVFNMSVTASVVVVFVLLARLLLKKAPKIFSYALWAVVLFRLLCPVSITTGFSLLGLFDAPVTEATTHTTAVEYIPQDVVHTPAPEVKLPMPGVNQSVNEALPQGDEQTAADPLEASVALATLVWLAGIGVMAVYSVVSLVRLRGRLVGAVLLRDNVYLADYIDSPFVMSIFRPKIYLPSSLSEQEQGYIILHEQHHIRRGDHIIKALAFLALCVHWFNPLVWVAFVLSAKDMEMSCDEAVVKKLGEEIRANYSASLLSLATGRRIIAGTPLAFGEGDTKSRIRNLLSWKQPKLWITVTAAVVCVAVVAACAANPQGTQRETVNTTGQYASMEEYVAQRMAAQKTVRLLVWEEPSLTVAEDPIEVSVTSQKLDFLDLNGSLEGLDPNGVLEVWMYSWLIQIDYSKIDSESVVLAGGQYMDDDGYIALDDAKIVVSLHYPDGSYDILDEQLLGDGMDFFGYHNSCEEAIYDWYVMENRLDLPLYVEDWIDRIPFSENDRPGNYPVHRYDGDGWYFYIPVGEWEQVATSADTYRYHWEWTSGYNTGSTLSVDRFTTPVSTLRDDARKQGFVPIDGTNHVWQYGDGNIRYYFHEAADGGCWRVTIDWDDSRITDYPYIAIQPEVLRLMAESFTVDSRFHGFTKPFLTLEDVLTLSEKGEVLTWDDFEPYSYIEKGNGDNLYVRIYPISGTELAVSIGGGLLTDPPGYINLADSDEYIDIRTGDVAAFIRSHQSGESSAEPLTAEEVAWFNDWFEPIVQDKQGNDIGVNARCCFLTSYYDDVTELNFEEFMRYFPGDGSRTSEAEFEALREVDGWPFDRVESLEKMPVPVHKYPKRLVDLILGEYAGISTEDLDTSSVAYLPEYNAYYNYTSDFGPGMFVCTHGERDGDTIRLYSVNGTGLLTLRQVDDTSYQIVSLQRLESPVG